MQVAIHFAMVGTRSRVPGGLPPLDWQGANPSNTQGSEAASAREARAAKRRPANEAALGVPPNANANRNSDVPLEDDANQDPAVAVNEEDPKELDPCDRDPPCEVWMGIQACGVRNEDVANSLAKNLFMSNFS